MTDPASGARRRILVTGGAGYVGSALVPRLLAAGYEVVVLDLYLYGLVFAEMARLDGLVELRGDIRDAAQVEAAVSGCWAVIHLACISNDPSFDLDPELGKAINYDCFSPLVQAAKAAGVERFIYASSSSVYGIKPDIDVTEDVALTPLTDYSKYKAMCEEILESEREPGFTTVTVRPATVCGYAPRQRLDLTVNIFANLAISRRQITVFGGEQLRPNLHVDDMVDLYLELLAAPSQTIDGRRWNAGHDNMSVRAIAELARDEIDPKVELIVTPTDDLRSYHISSERIRVELGFVPARSVRQALHDLKVAFAAGQVPDAMTDDRYYNIRRMRTLDLS